MRATDLTFDRRVLAARRPVLVHFWAPWNAPCLALAARLERLAGQFANRLMLVKVDLTENPGLAARYGVEGTPTLMFFRNGEVLKSVPPVALAGRSLERALEAHARGDV